MKGRIFYIVFFNVLSLSLFSQNLDIRLLRAVNSPVSHPADNYFRFFSNSEAVISIAIPAAVCSAGLIGHNDDTFRQGVVTIASLVVATGITQGLKYTINRPRPFITYPDIAKKSAGGSPSFPSGHTSSAFADATSISLSYPRWYVIAPSFLWAATVGYSRMELGVHYPSDVLAGALIGSGCAVLSHIINKKLSRKPWEKPCNCPKM